MTPGGIASAGSARVRGTSQVAVGVDTRMVWFGRQPLRRGARQMTGRVRYFANNGELVYFEDSEGNVVGAMQCYDPGRRS